jgi:hypothetical protein
MPTALLALPLLATTVDQRLSLPLAILAATRDAAGEPIGRSYADLPWELQLTLVVAPLPAGHGGRYDSRTRTLTIAEALLDEDPRVVAVGLVHELQHSLDRDLISQGLLEYDCVELEVRAFEAQVRVTRALWPDELPTGTDWEKGLTMIVTAYEAGGLDGLRAMVRGVDGYHEQCTARVAEAAP